MCSGAHLPQLVWIAVLRSRSPSTQFPETLIQLTSAKALGQIRGRLSQACSCVKKFCADRSFTPAALAFATTAYPNKASLS